MGLEGWGLSAADPALAVAPAGDELRARFTGRPAPRARFRLSRDAGPGLPVSAAYPLRAGLATAAGEARPAHGGLSARPLSLRQLAEHVAYGEGRQSLRARLIDGAHGPLAGGDASWTFEDELPLRGVAADLSALMLPCARIDLYAELTFDGWSERWLVSPFEAALAFNGEALSLIENVPLDETAHVRGRSVVEPWEEVALADAPPSAWVNRRLPDLPPVGGGWIVYLRRGPDVISRPTYKRFGRESEAGRGLAAAALLPPEAREPAILARLDAIAAGEDDAAAELRGLARTCGSLNGLPPGSLDVLRLLARRPGAAARLALAAAGADERDAILALSDALPFAWCLVPVGCWTNAVELARCELATTLAATPGIAPDVAASTADAAVKATLAQLARAEPLLRWPLFLSGSAPPDASPRKVGDAAQDHLRRHGDRSDGRGSLFRSLAPALLPADFLAFDVSHLETLDAPCAAAAAAAGRVTLPDDAVRRLKTAHRVDPIYFVEAYEAWFMHLMRTSPR